MKHYKSHISLLFATSILIIAALGCGGGSRDACIGTVTYEGKTFQGAGKNEIDAKLFACNKFCSDADPEFDARYRIWLNSPKGKAAGSPSKREAMFKDKELLDYVTNVCAHRCTSSMNPEAKCK
jgi:hypothetical protein